MHARERLYLNAAQTSLVGADHPDASFLYASVGDEIPDSAAAKFGLVDGLIVAAAAVTSLAALLGSSVLPALVDINGDVQLQLGAIVAKSHTDSGLTVDEWNALPEADREAKLQATIEALRAAPPTPPAAKPKVAKAKAPAKPKAAKSEEKPKQQPAPPNKEQTADENKGG